MTELAINEIHEGDCLELMCEIPTGTVDMILCDLPYGTTQNKWDSVIPLEPLWTEYERVIKDNGAIVLTAQTPFDKVLGVSNLKLLRYEWIWRKQRGTGHLNAKKMPMKQHENILVFYKRLPTYNPQYREGIPYTKNNHQSEIDNYGRRAGFVVSKSEGKRFPLSVLEFDTVDRTVHKTQKPVALFEYLIRTYTNEGETVLDNCIGSGTTAIAAINTNRSFIGIEREPAYVQIARQRIAEIDGRTANE